VRNRFKILHAVVARTRIGKNRRICLGGRWRIVWLLLIHIAKKSICEEDYPLLRCSGVVRRGIRDNVPKRASRVWQSLFCYLWLHYRKRRKDSKCVGDAACETKVCIKWRSTFLRCHAELNPPLRSISSAHFYPLSHAGVAPFYAPRMLAADRSCNCERIFS